MTGEEHFQAAEKLLSPEYTWKWVDPSPERVARAQAHATLALAAAVHDRGRELTVGDVEIRPAVPR